MIFRDCGDPGEQSKLRVSYVSSVNTPCLENTTVAFIKKNPWILIASALTILVVIGIATS